MLLPDINVWLALAFEVHFHHSAAKAWFESIGSEGCAFCRLTQQGFLRLATNPSVFQDDAVTLENAWLLYDEMLQDPQIVFVSEPVGIESHWRQYTQRRSFSPKVWNDAYLAAFARAAGLELVTFDKGFRQYSQIDCQILT